MSFGVTKDYKLKVRNLPASHTLGWMNTVQYVTGLFVYYESMKRKVI